MAERASSAGPTVEDSREGVQTRFLDGLIGYTLRRASGEATADFYNAMEGTGMRPALAAILSVVEENPGVKQGVVGRALGIARANMAPLMLHLEQQGLLRRLPDQADRRAVAIYLTEKGEVVLRDCKQKIIAQEERFFGALTPSEQEMLKKLLLKL